MEKASFDSTKDTVADMKKDPQRFQEWQIKLSKAMYQAGYDEWAELRAQPAYLKHNPGIKLTFQTIDPQHFNLIDYPDIIISYNRYNNQLPK